MNIDATEEQIVVIVGAGLAGGNAAVTLREEGWRGRIVLLGAESGIPFGRPPLSKTYLRGEEDLSAWYVKPADWYGDHDVELRTGSTVRQVDTALKQTATRKWSNGGLRQAGALHWRKKQALCSARSEPAGRLSAAHGRGV